MLHCYSGIDHVLVVYSNSLEWGYICYFMLYFFAAVSNLYLMEIKCNVVVGAANMIKIY